MWYFRKHTVMSIPGLVLLALTLVYIVAFFAYIGVSQKRGRLVKTNSFVYMWEALVGAFLCLQALFVISAYRSSNRYLYWTPIWMAYGAVMSIMSICVVGGYAGAQNAVASVWAVFWLLPAVAISVYAAKARRGYAVDR
ncbi:hypothetical protein IWW36_005601, partial [Coemansia brasiliensis]